jgi:hypothetical protein
LTGTCSGITCAATARAEYQADSDRCKKLFFQNGGHIFQKIKLPARTIFPEGISNGNNVERQY